MLLRRSDGTTCTDYAEILETIAVGDYIEDVDQRYYGLLLGLIQVQSRFSNERLTYTVGLGGNFLLTDYIANFCCSKRSA